MTLGLGARLEVHLNQYLGVFHTMSTFLLLSGASWHGEVVVEVGPQCSLEVLDVATFIWPWTIVD